jgi:hypothetical protein
MIDWTVHDKFPESTCACLCGAVFRSHAKYVMPSGLVSRKPCPLCGNTTSLRAVRSDPESFTIGEK